MKKHLLLFLLICSGVFAQEDININQLNWLPNSHSFWVNSQDNVAVYDVDKLNQKKIILSDDQLKNSGFTG